MQSVLKILIGVCVATATFGSDDSTQKSLTEDALRLEINREGFNQLSQLISRRVLQDINQAPVENFDTDVGYGVQAYFSGLNYSIDFGDIEFITSHGRLTAHLKLNRVDVNVQSVQFVKELGMTVKTTCKDTRMVAGLSSPLSLAVDLETKVLNGRISFVPMGIAFDVPEDQYEIHGPEKCSGSLGVGHVIQYAVHKTLQNSSERIANAVRERVSSAVPELDRLVNELVEKEYAVSIGSGGVLGKKDFFLLAIPDRISVSDESVFVAIDVQINEFSSFAKSSPVSNFRFDDMFVRKFGQVSFKLQLVNELFQRALSAAGRAEVELDVSSPPLNQLFTRESLGAIWPDLNTVKLDTDQIFAKVAIASPPQITSARNRDGGIELGVSVQNFKIMLEIVQGGQRRPYFDLNLSAAVLGVLEKDGDTLKISMKSPSSVQVNGKWADGYVPGNDIFENDVAKMLFNGIFEVLSYAGTLARIQVPKLDLGEGDTFEFLNPSVDGEYIVLPIGGV